MPRLAILLAPSRAASVELPRRVALRGIPLAGILPMTLRDLAQAIAEPQLFEQGRAAWDLSHAVHLAETLLGAPGGFTVPDGQPRGPFALGLARTLEALRGAGLEPAGLRALAAAAATPEDRQRLAALAASYERYWGVVEGRFADRAALCRTAAQRVGRTGWLAGAEVLIADDLSPDHVESTLLAALALSLPVRRIEGALPPGLVAGSFASWCAAHGMAGVAAAETLLAPVETSFPPLPAGLERIRTCLFEPPAGDPCGDDAVELLTAPGEAAEARAIVRRLLREAGRGVPFEEMGVLLPRAETYTSLFADTLRRASIPYRLHPSLPLATGRIGRSLLLLFACRGLARRAVMEFLTFAPVAFDELLGDGRPRRPWAWDTISREAGVVGGLERWIIGLRAYVEELRGAAASASSDTRRSSCLARAEDAEDLLRVVELLSATLDALAGVASWPEWAERLAETLGDWMGVDGEPEPTQEREVVAAVIAGLGQLAGERVPWERVERVLADRFAWERMPLEPLALGGVHVGSLDALAGVPFRLVALPGLVEGGYPGVIRQDPFLLDEERERLSSGPPPAPAPPPPRAHAGEQLSLFDDPPSGAAPGAGIAQAELPLLPTAHQRLLEERRTFHRAVRQAREKLIVSYPRADARTGRERLPSLFFVAVATAREGRLLSAADLERLVQEDALATLPLDQAVDRGERDRARLRRDPGAAAAIAAGSSFFAQARRLARARWSRRVTAFDGFVGQLPRDLARRLDPAGTQGPVSASRLSTFARCGFQYFLRYVLRLEVQPSPDERLRLEALERGNLFHAVAERFLRELRDAGALPLRDTPETRAALGRVTEAALDALVAGSPPRYTALWETERRRFHALVTSWFEREVAQAPRSRPLYFEVAFGRGDPPATGEPHLADPVVVELGGRRTLRLEGRIDRVDERPDGALVLRDYKTGRAPRENGGAFRAGVELQIPIYLLAAGSIFPGRRVAEAFLDYVDGGRPVHVETEGDWEARLGRLLAGMVDAMADGLFLQEPTACATCDFTGVCGPQPVLERQQHEKRSDPRLERLLRLRETT